MQLHQRLISVVAFALCTVTVAVSHGQGDSDVRVPLPRPPDLPLAQPLFGRPVCDDFRAREEKISAELRAIPLHPWAGRYYGAGVAVELAPKSGIVYTRHGCFGLADFDHGSLVQKGKSRLRFRLRNKRTHGLFSGKSQELVIVPWGDRRYLIPVEEMLDFVSAVNLGREPGSTVSGRNPFLLHEGDDKKKVAGKPKLPKKFARLILQRPVKAKIISIGDPVVEKGPDQLISQNVVKVTIDRGKSHGIFLGMQLVLDEVGFGPSISTSRVVGVRQKTADVALVMPWMTEEDAAEPCVGWRLSTREMSVDEWVARMCQKQ